MQENKPSSNKLPSVQHMQQTLRQSGVLEKVTPFPQQSGAEVLQQTATKQTQSQLASAEADTETAITAEAEFELQRFVHFIPKLVGFFLTIKSLLEMYDSIFFILVDFPELELALEQNLNTNQEINTFVTQAIMTTISTILSLIFALRITIMKTKAARILNTTIGICLLLGGAALQQYFNQITSRVEVANQSASLLEKISSFINDLIGT